MTKQIPLTRGKKALVDDSDYPEISQYKWCCHSEGYALRGTATGKVIYMHRQIMQAPAHLMVDHINGDRLDNQRGNLRLCTRTQQNKNKRQHGRTSQFKGVSLHKETQKWAAWIMSDRQRYYLGLFESELEAALAYDEAARQLHAEFARLNFP